MEESHIGVVGDLTLVCGLVVMHYLALLPDIGKPGNWIGQRVRAGVTVLSGLLSTGVVFVHQLLLTVAPIVIVGALIDMAFDALELHEICCAASINRYYAPT